MTKSTKWSGHACFVITTPGRTSVVIDPWIADNPLRPVKFDGIKAVDIVLITHDHFDHLGDAADISTKTGTTLVAAPETAGRLQSQMGVKDQNMVFGGYGMNIGGSANIEGNARIVFQLA